MRILVLAPILPDLPSDGDKLRLHHILCGLSRSHRVTLACFRGKDEPALTRLPGVAEEIHSLAWPRWRQWLAAGLRYPLDLPSNVAAYASADMRRLVDQLLAEKRFDTLLCYRLRMVPYALRARLPRILDFTDSLTRYFERRSAQDTRLCSRLWRLEAKRLAAYESWSAWQYDACLMNSAADAETLRAMAPQARVVTAANGADLSLAPPRRKTSDPERMVFAGNLAYPPNAKGLRWFAKEVLPRIRAKRPNARLIVLGGPAPLADLAGQEGLEFVGFVKDLRPQLWAAGLSICPIHLGTGRQNKILDAFAAGTPVVATSLAANGVEAQPGRELLCADSAKDFSRACLEVMLRPALGRRLVGAALRFVRRRYNWKRTIHLIERELQKARSFAELPKAGR